MTTYQYGSQEYSGNGPIYEETVGDLLEDQRERNAMVNVIARSFPGAAKPPAKPTFVVPNPLTDVDPIEIHCATAGANIFYTTNGDVPDSGSTAYTVPFTLGAGSYTIKAISYLGAVYCDGIASVAVTVSAS